MSAELRRCSAAECDKAARSCDRYCAMHRGRLTRHGNLQGNPRPGPEERLWSQVERTDTCWLWGGWTNENGYGAMRVGGKTVRVHRYSYELARGPIPRGLVVDHVCRVRNCVNPDHLEAVSQPENIARGISPTAVNGRKTHCKRGHEFTPKNIIPRGDGYRECRTCRALYLQGLRARVIATKEDA